MPTNLLNDLLGQHQLDRVLSIIIEKFQVLASRSDFILCEGSAFEFNVNQEIAKNLGCPILVLGNADGRSVADALRPVQIAVDTYRKHNCQIAGVLLNKAVPERVDTLTAALSNCYGDTGCVLAVIPFDRQLIAPYVQDIARQLQAEVLYGRDLLGRLPAHFLVAAMQMQNALNWLQEDSLIITPGDRGDMLQARQSTNYPHLAGILLSTGLKPEPSIAKLIEGLPQTLPILSVKTDTYTTVSQIKEVRSTLKPDDREKIALSIRTFERYVELVRLEAQLSLVKSQEPTPRLFNYKPIQQAKANPPHSLQKLRSPQRILLDRSASNPAWHFCPILLAIPPKARRSIKFAKRLKLSENGDQT